MANTTTKLTMPKSARISRLSKVEKPLTLTVRGFQNWCRRDDHMHQSAAPKLLILKALPAMEGLKLPRRLPRTLCGK
jgi:hypothetical protein